MLDINKGVTDAKQKKENLVVSFPFLASMEVRLSHCGIHRPNSGNRPWICVDGCWNHSQCHYRWTGCWTTSNFDRYPAGFAWNVLR